MFCVELLSYWSIWFITGCASVNTVWEDRRGDYLEMVLLIGVCLQRGLHVAQHTGGAALERCCTKRQQANTSWDCVFMTSCLLFTVMYLILRGHFGRRWRSVTSKTNDVSKIHLIGSKSFHWKSFFLSSRVLFSLHMCVQEEWGDFWSPHFFQD